MRRRFRLLVAMVPCAVLLVWALSAQAGESEGEAVFNEKCHACHKLPDPSHPPDVGWTQQLKKMAVFAGLNGKQKADVLAFLLSHDKSATETVSLAEDRQLFEKKCSRCHTPERVFLTQPDADTLQHIVERMQSFESGWISQDDAQKIIKYVGSVLASNQAQSSSKKAPAPSSPDQVFVQRCTGCHTLERIFLKLEKEGHVDWNHIVSRMQQKAPQWIDQKEAEEILAFLQTLKPPSGTVQDDQGAGSH